MGSLVFLTQTRTAICVEVFSCVMSDQFALNIRIGWFPSNFMDVWRSCTVASWNNSSGNIMVQFPHWWLLTHAKEETYCMTMPQDWPRFPYLINCYFSGTNSKIFILEVSPSPSALTLKFPTCLNFYISSIRSGAWCTWDLECVRKCVTSFMVLWYGISVSPHLFFFFKYWQAVTCPLKQLIMNIIITGY